MYDTYDNIQIALSNVCSWLTNYNYRLLHEPDAAILREAVIDNAIAVAHGGQAFAAAHLLKVIRCFYNEMAQ